MSRQKVKKEELIGEKGKFIKSLSVKESQMVRSAGCCSLVISHCIAVSAASVVKYILTLFVKAFKVI